MSGVSTPEFPHHVRRLLVKVSGVSTTAAALGWRSELRTVLEGELPDVLASALDEVAERLGLGGATLRLPRLELDLSVADAVGFDEALKNALTTALRGVAWSPPRSERARARDMLLSYIKLGRLSWYDDEADAARLLPRLRVAAARWLDEVLRGEGAPALPVGAELGIQGPSTVVLRLARLLDAAAVDRLRSAVASNTEWHHARRGRDDGTSEAADSLTSSANEADPARLLWLVLRSVRQPAIAPSSVALRDVPDASGGATGTPEAHPAALSEPPESRSAVLDARISESGAGINVGSSPDSASEVASGWIAHDAGLVLLHPYLGTLLGTLGCLDSEGRCLRDAAIPRAAIMLGWLATGSDEIYEFELTVAKLLLGLPPDAAVSLGHSTRVDKGMREQGEALLAAVIDHWGALGSTGADALRLSFLARNGLLSRAESGEWHLRVADEAYDVLLGRLPWGFGIVRLPWMPQPLHVHWGTAGC